MNRGTRRTCSRSRIARMNARKPCFVSFVRIEPARLELALARRLDGVVLDALRRSPGRSAPCGQAPSKRLIEHVFVAGDGLRAGRAIVTKRAFSRAIRATCSAHSSGNSDSARMRVRASSPRLVSWVAVAVRPCGDRSARSRHALVEIARPTAPAASDGRRLRSAPSSAW